MAGPTYHVLYLRPKWVVVLEGEEAPRYHFASRPAALGAARSCARQTGGEVVLHREDGAEERREAVTAVSSKTPAAVIPRPS